MLDTVKLVRSLEKVNQNIVDRESKNEIRFDSFRQRMSSPKRGEREDRSDRERRGGGSKLADEIFTQSGRSERGNSFPDWQYSNERKKQDQGVGSDEVSERIDREAEESNGGERRDQRGQLALP